MENGMRNQKEMGMEKGMRTLEWDGTGEGDEDLGKGWGCKG